MAIIKQPGQEDIGGVPVVSSGAGRARPAAGGVSRSSSSSGQGGGGGGPGFVNITKMLDLNKGQGQAQANAVTAGKDEQGQGIKSSFNDLEGGFNSSLDKEKQEAGIGVQGSKPTSGVTTWNSTQHSPWSESDYADNEKYANNNFDGPADIRSNNAEKYDETMTKADNFVKDVNSLGTQGGLQNQIQAKYGTNNSLYGSAFDEQLTRVNGHGQFQDLQNRYNGLYDMLSGSNKASADRSNAVRDQAKSAKDYNQSEFTTKKASVDEDKHLTDSGYFDPNTFYTDLTFTGNASGGITHVPVTYGEYAMDRQKRGLPYMSEAEFKRGQAMHGVNPDARSNPYVSSDTRKVGTIKQS